MVGLIGIDPGVTTGVSWGLFNEALRDKTSNWNALRKGRATGCVQIGPKDPWKGQKPQDAHAAALMVADCVVSLIADFNIRGLAKGEIQIGIEQFEVRGVAVGATADTGLSPVFIDGVIYGALCAIGWGENLQYVKASQHKGYANNDRLRRLGRATKGRIGWTRGRPHTRDSWRIIAYMLNRTP